MGSGQDKIMRKRVLLSRENNNNKVTASQSVQSCYEKKILTRTLGITGKLQNARQKKQLQHMEELKARHRLNLPCELQHLREDYKVV